MTERQDIPGTAPVTDRRPVPRGVIPRGVQTWMMAALAVGILLIIFLTGRPGSPVAARPAPTATAATDADRVRNYQERLRALDAEAAEEVKALASSSKTLPPSFDNDREPATQADPLEADRRRRDYESLFASNVVLSRRPERPDSGTTPANREGMAPGGRGEPSLDDIADAVVRASSRDAGAVPLVAAVAGRAGTVASTAPAAIEGSRRTGPIGAAGAMHRILEGTLIEAVLTNRLDGDAAAPVNCLVTTPVYAHSGQQVVIPAGARLLGETKPVQAVGETRLAVVFHRLLMPDGSTTSLDQFRGLNQRGDSGLSDRVNQHYWATFGAASAVGLVSGLSQMVGTAGLAGSDRDRTVVIAGSGTDAASQATSQVMNRFLNRLPTITIREGQRVRVYVTSDLELPAWPPVAATGESQGR